MAALFVAPFKGDWTMWTWLQDVLPCPSDLILLVVAQRFSTTATAVDVRSQKVIVEVQMHPPNDLHNSTKTLLRQEWPLIELLPRPNESFVLRLGDVPLKHKATLLVNLRSSNPPGSVVAPFAITSITLRARQSFALNKPLSSMPKGSSSMPSSSTAASLVHPLLRTPVETVALPRFRHGAHWHACPAQPSKPKKFIPLSILRSRQNAIIKEETAELTLKSPSPLLYTRPIASTSESGEKTYGPKTWHYPLTAGNVSYGEMRMFSDGIEGVREQTNQVTDQAAKAFGEDSEQFRQIKEKMEGAFTQLLITLQGFDDDKTSALFGVSRTA
ncbi:hypothetical protein BKA67DRAFT_139810 [Truncatella angustata]|uniref:Uncharacterized protein n=1 Tax=Truncatella angustata TaxID=152316 RepID=A0A9P8RJP8_9PEZI|nr:uncharacterized protein BKA67DRAFT_139810 [Truncatella angustata]KAH6640045.1 hypothetical protein BKA67DRAFT_139810 [Truncatella angustata]